MSRQAAEQTGRLDFLDTIDPTTSLVIRQNTAFHSSVFSPAYFQTSVEHVTIYIHISSPVMDVCQLNLKTKVNSRLKMGGINILIL